MGDDKGSGNPDYRLALWIGAAVLVGVAIMIGVDWPTQTNAPAPNAMGGEARDFAQPAAPPQDQSPRGIADQLFNRAMMAHETGQTQQAAVFLPEAIAAYQKLEPLDADALFHLSLLQLAAGDQSQARASADRILAVAPDHLLGLAAAAQASEQSAPNEAKQFWQRFLDVFDEQQGRTPEYGHHQQMFPMLRTRASAFLVRGTANAMPPGAAANNPAP